jgi:hypothetical protein
LSGKSKSLLAKAPELQCSRLVKKLDDSGFIDQMVKNYGFAR